MKAYNKLSCLFTGLLFLSCNISHPSYEPVIINQTGYEPKSVRQAHEAAVKVSAYVCTCQGAMPVIPEDLRG